LFSFLYGQDIPQSFNVGDVVHIDNCDKYGWCELKDGGYIKEYLFKKHPKYPHIAMKSTKGTTFLYEIRPIFKDEKPLYEYIELKEQVREYKNAKRNFVYGYVRQKDIESYEGGLVIKKEKKVQLKELKPLQDEVILSEDSEVANDNESKKKTILKKIRSKYFLFANIGESFVDINADVKDITLGGGLGYNYSNDYFVAIGYQHTFLKHIYIVNSYVSVNYNIKDIPYSPYLGVMLGYSILNVYNEPSTGNVLTDTTDSGFSIGVQSGLAYTLENIDDGLRRLYLTTTFQYWKHFLDTRVNNNTIKLKGAINLLVGLKYRF
jgi:hypothetical protein